MQSKQSNRHNSTTDTIEYLENTAETEASLVFEEVDEDLMDSLVDRRLHGDSH